MAMCVPQTPKPRGRLWSGDTHACPLPLMPGTPTVLQETVPRGASSPARVPRHCNSAGSSVQSVCNRIPALTSPLVVGGGAD